jgi:hypothetical protein
MKIKSLEEFNGIIVEIIRRNLEANVEAMQAQGMTPQEISDHLPCLFAMCEQAHSEAMLHLQSMLCDGDGRDLPSYAIN